ncbi:unnamed protein product, partial [Coregonus sp. 'balchen']
MVFVMSDNLGLGLPFKPQKLTVSKDFSLSLDTPKCITRGEQLVLKVNLFNHLEQDMVILVVAESQRFVCSGRPCFYGERTPEGKEQSFSETVFLELAPSECNLSRQLHFSFPPDVVPGSERAHFALRDDASFRAFGASDASGSTWLTAFVLRCFLQTWSFVQIDQSILSRAMGWLVQQQGSQGEFIEVGRVIHTALQGGLDGPVSLNAYVLMTLLEDQTYLSDFNINSTNYLVHQTKEMNVLYNMEDRVLSERSQADTEGFSLDVEAFDDENDLDHTVSCYPYAPVVIVIYASTMYNHAINFCQAVREPEDSSD